MTRIGIDIVDIARLERALARWPRLASRVFTPLELSYAGGRSRPGQHLAARFAAKEAAFKALGAGWPQVSWKDIEIASTPHGPTLKLTGKAARIAGPAPVRVSLAHDGGMAVAQVLIEGPEPPGL